MKMRFVKDLKDTNPMIPAGTVCDETKPSKYIPKAFNVVVGEFRIMAVPASYLEEVQP